MNDDPVELFEGQTGPLYWANLTAKEDVIVNQGGSWSGKTHSIMQVLFTIAVMRPNYIITVISNTVTKLKEDALRISKSIISNNRRLQLYIREYNSTDRVYTFINGSLIEFKSFEDQEQAKGGKRHILYVNEASRIKYMVFFEAQLRTLVRTFVDYNPTSQFWVHDSVINNRLEYTSVKVIRSWHIHNPFLTDKQRERLENIQDKEMWKVYARGLTGILKGTVYPNWTEVNDFLWSDDVIYYVDFGYTNDPTAAGRIAIRPKGTDFDYVADELTYSPGIPMGVLVNKFKENGYKEGQLCYCDHDPTLIRELRMMDIAAVSAIKGPNSIISRILFMRSRKIGYTKRSVNIKEELRRYKFIEIDGHITNTPADEWNHHMDGISYGCQTYALQSGEI
jgi:phage terminase large subunit